MAGLRSEVQQGADGAFDLDDAPVADAVDGAEVREAVAENGGGPEADVLAAAPASYVPTPTAWLASRSGVRVGARVEKRFPGFGVHRGTVVELGADDVVVRWETDERTTLSLKEASRRVVAAPARKTERAAARPRAPARKTERSAARPRPLPARRPAPAPAAPATEAPAAADETAAPAADEAAADDEPAADDAAAIPPASGDPDDNEETLDDMRARAAAPPEAEVLQAMLDEDEDEEPAAAPVPAPAADEPAADDDSAPPLPPAVAPPLPAPELAAAAPSPAAPTASQAPAWATVCAEVLAAVQADGLMGVCDRLMGRGFRCGPKYDKKSTWPDTTRSRCPPPSHPATTS